jgi:hypothetical protein
MLLSVQPVHTKADAGSRGVPPLVCGACPIAAHIARWPYAARVRPLEPAALHAGDEAIEVLKLASRYHHLPLPRRPWTLRDVTLRLAEMGGYEPRKDQPPGWKVIWRGWRVFNNLGPPTNLWVALTLNNCPEDWLISIGGSRAGRTGLLGVKKGLRVCKNTSHNLPARYTTTHRESDQAVA